MQLEELQFLPGIVKERTARGAKPMYKDCNRVRFHEGQPELLGGWTSLGITFPSGPTIDGTFYADPPRAAHEWSSIDNQKWIAVATDRRLYLLNRSEIDASPLAPPYFNITPAESTGTLANPFSTTNGSPNVTVAHTGHGLEDRQGVSFSGATAVGGITINGDYFIEVIDANSYRIVHSANATSTAGPGGGAAVAYVYEIPPPVDENATYGGYGVGGYGTGGYSEPRALITTAPADLRIWSLDNWGEDLMASPRGGAIYTWDRTLGPDVRATIISNAPQTNNRILVSAEDRHMLSIGSHDGVNRDQMLVRWCDAEDYNQWTPADDNTAGDKRLDYGSRLIAALRTRTEIILWTDRSMFSARFDPDPSVVFGFNPLGESVQIVGPQAAVEVNGVVYFMGVGDFFRYDGIITPMQCAVKSFVFDSLNAQRMEKVVASVNRMYSEIWWHYPTSSSENDRYVIYNYLEQTWSIGSMERSMFHDTGPFFRKPFACSPDGVFYIHENSYSDDGQDLDWHLETHDIEIGVGDTFLHVARIVPDFIRIDGAVAITLRGKRYPHSATSTSKGPRIINASTKKVDMRLRARQISILLERSGMSSFWRSGTWRSGIVGHGKR